MAKKEALRELQSRLAQRLQEARTQQQRSSWLAVECGGHAFLFPLREAGEIFALAPIVSVPHTHPWFLGVSNLRGHLHGVVDLAGFLGLKAADAAPGPSPQAQLVGFNHALDLNCALVVDRLAGLRGEESLRREADAAGPKPAFVGGRYRDGAGRLWQELSLAALANDEAFLRIVG